MEKLGTREVDTARFKLKERYGVDMGDTGTVLVLAHNSELAESKKAIHQATERINQSTTALQTNEPRAAFWFGVGRSSPWCLVCLVAVIATIFFYYKSDKYQQEADYVKKIHLYTNVMRYGKLVDGEYEKAEDLSNGAYLKLSAPKSTTDAEAGKHFIRSKNGQVVYVPLSF
ncbi:hypothetical protein [Fibrella aquatica]|uniref:hypothetical protein n=1 Tax=Fibrella aquatica TaxID=3242487 RepID=UPI00351FE0CA